MNQKEKWLQTASKQLKMSPDELKGYLQKGDLASIMSKMEGKDAQKLKDAMKNPEMVKNIKKSAEQMNK